MVKFKNFSRLLRVFLVLFKANLISRTFKTVLYIQALFKPVRTLYNLSMALLQACLKTFIGTTLEVHLQRCHSLCTDNFFADLDIWFLAAECRRGCDVKSTVKYAVAVTC